MPMIDFSKDNIEYVEFNNLSELLDEIRNKSKMAGYPAQSCDDPSSLRIGWFLTNSIEPSKTYYFIKLLNLKPSIKNSPYRDMLTTSEGRMQLAKDLFNS